MLPLAVALLFSLWLAGGAAPNAQEIRRANEIGMTGLNGPRWRNSEVLQYIRKLPADSLVFSDNSRAIYIYTGHPGNRRLLRERRGAMRQMEKVEEGAYVVKWLYSHIYSSHYNYGITELPGLEPVAELSDGLIFRVNRAYDRAGALREEYRAITSGEPAIRSNFDVYLVENTLHFVKAPCDRGDTEAKFFLHLIPADEGDLPERRKQHGFDNLDFGFNQHGLTFDGKCLATVSLPEYAIAAIRTGQYVRVGGGFNRIWEGEFRLER